MESTYSDNHYHKTMKIQDLKLGWKNSVLESQLVLSAEIWTLPKTSVTADETHWHAFYLYRWVTGNHRVFIHSQCHCEGKSVCVCWDNHTLGLVRNRICCYAPIQRSDRTRFQPIKASVVATCRNDLYINCLFKCLTIKKQINWTFYNKRRVNKEVQKH